MRERVPGFPGYLVPLTGLVFGGHDITETSLRKRAEQLGRAGVISPDLPELLAPDLDTADAEIRPGYVPGDGGRAATRLIDDIAGFRARHRLARVVVVNVSSTEPPVDPRPEFKRLADLEERLAAGDDVLPPSSLYAYAAFHAGCGYVDFTPSTGPTLPALAELAARRGVPYAGRDGKTGETLVKSGARAHVRRPGTAGALLVRAQPARRRRRGDPRRSGRQVVSKQLSKDQVVAQILGRSRRG